MSLRLRPLWRDVVFLGILIVAIWLPRGLALDRFATPDEARWLARSGNFYHALTHGVAAHTYQMFHPGVTTMWAGTAGFLWRYPAYAREASGQVDRSGMKIGPLLQARGHEPLELLTAGRVFVVLSITAILVASFMVAVRLIGLLPALVGFLLIAFDPFHVAHSRLLHLDGLVSSLMLLSLLAFLSYIYCGRRRFDLVVSAVAAGLSWLTKSPAFFLAPFAGLLMLVELRRERHRLRIEDLQRAAWPLMAWAGVGLAVFVLLWPAMWVDPIGSLFLVLNKSKIAAKGHFSSLYFNGAVIKGGGDPGLHFYPITYLWRTTPVVLVGLGLAAVAFALQRTPLAQREPRRTAIVLALFAVVFTLFMSLGAKKFDRYLLPVYAPLDLVAAMGWVAAARWLRGRRFALLARFGAPALLGTAIVVQLLGPLQTFPYYLSYYNPLLGGAVKAPEVMLIGWGEGLDQAARYLNAKPNAEQMRVTSWYPRGPFSYFFKGQTTSMPWTWNTTKARQLLSSDYLVLYAHQWQRQLPNRELLAYFAQQTPEHVIRINGLDYAQIYNLLGRRAEAAGSSAQAAKVEPRNLRYQYQAARDAQRVGDYKGSLKHLEACEEIQPGYSDTYFWRGFALQKIGNLEEAVKYYRMHLELAPGHKQTEFNLAHALMTQGECQEAIGHFKRTLEIAPNYREVHLHLASCYEKIGNREEQEKHLALYKAGNK